MRNSNILKRFIAIMIDVSVIGAICSPFIIMSIFYSSDSSTIFPICSFSFIFSSVLCKDLFDGRSIGKQTMKLKISDRRNVNNKISNIKLICRNIFAIIWAVEIVLIFINNGRRFGDVVTGLNVEQCESEKQKINLKMDLRYFFTVFIIVFALSYTVINALKNNYLFKLLFI